MEIERERREGLSAISEAVCDICTVAISCYGPQNMQSLQKGQKYFIGFHFSLFTP